MKISTTQIFERSIDQMSNQRTKVAEIQAQLASGKQIVQPSDDAEQAGIIQRLSSAFKRQEVYETTLDSVTTRLEVEESAVMSAENIMQRARELAVQGSNGTLTQGDRKILAHEVSSLRDELLALANSQDATGNYVFSGSMAQTPPFVESADGTVNYRGDDNRVQVAISEQRRERFRCALVHRVGLAFDFGPRGTWTRTDCSAPRLAEALIKPSDRQERRAAHEERANVHNRCIVGCNRGGAAA